MLAYFSIKKHLQHLNRFNSTCHQADLLPYLAICIEALAITACRKINFHISQCIMIYLYPTQNHKIGYLKVKMKGSNGAINFIYYPGSQIEVGFGIVTASSFWCSNDLIRSALPISDILFADRLVAVIKRGIPMFAKERIGAYDPLEPRELVYRVTGFLVRGRISPRDGLNRMGQHYAMNHDTKRLREYLAAYLWRPYPRPHRIDRHIMITEIAPTNVTSLRDHKIISYYRS